MIHITEWVEFLKKREFDKNKLYNRSLLDHLIATYQLGVKLDCSIEVCLAGLFHSIYGRNKAYKFNGIALSNRQEIISLIGKSTENLVYLFWNSEYNGSLKLNLAKRDNFSITLYDNSVLHLDTPTASSLINLSAINLLEQVIYALKNSLAPKQELLTYIAPYKEAKMLLSPRAYEELIIYTSICSNL